MHAFSLLFTFPQYILPNAVFPSFSSISSLRDKLIPSSHPQRHYYAEGWVSSGLTFVNFTAPLSLSALPSHSLSLNGCKQFRRFLNFSQKIASFVSYLTPLKSNFISLSIQHYVLISKEII